MSGGNDMIIRQGGVYFGFRVVLGPALGKMLA